ncbi:MAG TPA: fumarylacetoacetase [Phycisphaerales bacterium]|nr:fumarylacetoacetase [Phycisphaerales bacterium]
MHNDTHNPHLRSWVESANDPSTDFPIQNLPLCSMLKEHDGHAHAHYGVAIGDQILDLSTLWEANAFPRPAEESGVDEQLVEDLARAMEYPHWMGIIDRPDLLALVRRDVQHFLLDGPAGGQQARRLRQRALVPMNSVQLLPPVSLLNYTDFYASLHHASTVGAMFRPDNPLLPNYKHVPIGYHGRASSIVVSGTPIRRPSGQQSPPDDNPAAGPTFGPCKLLDYELEVGCVIGRGNQMGEPISIANARHHMLGLVLVNDWSARDVQKWEYQPLGPFLAKNFATSISPFVVTMEALEPFRCPGWSRAAGDPQPLDYLSSREDQDSGGFDITLEVWLRSAQMAEKNLPAVRLSHGSFREMYWTFAQMIAHHTSNGCNFQEGDLIASGTVSGPDAESRGCLLERTWDGIDPATKKPRPRKPIDLPTGEKRTFLADGDTVILRGFCEREGFRRIGFGECAGTITT